MREAIALNVDVNTPYEQIISKMMQYFNARSQMKAAESRYPVVAIGNRKCSRLSTGFHHRPWRFERVNSGVTLCFACGRMGHKARQCHFSHKRRMGYRDLFKKIVCLETQFALLKGNKEEAIHT